MLIRAYGSSLECHLAERVGFEPTVDSRPRLISSQVHSTTLPPLRVENQYFRKIEILTEVLLVALVCETMASTA